MVDNTYSNTVRIGVKRKLNHVDTDHTDLSRKTSRNQMGSCSSHLTLDMYTQTDMSFLSSYNTTLINIADMVEENQRRLGTIEQFLTSIDNKISSFISENNSDNNDEKKLCIKTPRTPVALTTSSDADADGLHASPIVGMKAGLPTCQDQSNSSSAWALDQIHRLDCCSKPPHDSRAELALSKSLDIGIHEIASNVLVPVIFASDNKRKKTSTAEIPLQDLLNGNVANPEDNVSMFRGCWLGDRFVPDSRVWYYGDPRIIQRAEASGSNPAKLSLNLLEALFTREEMAASNVNGARGRELLDPIKIKAIYAHINYKFPTELEKQELRWHLLKPRIDSKCRAQRRIQRDYQVIGDNHSGQSTMKEKPFRSKLAKPSLDPKMKEELLYGYMKSDAIGATTSQHALSYVTMGASETDESTANLDSEENTQQPDHSQAPIVVYPH